MAGQSRPPLSILAFCAGHLAVDWPHGAFWILAPAVALSMDLGPSELGLMVTLIAVGSMLSFIPAGMICDHSSRRGPLFVATFVWVAVGYGAASLAPDAWTLTAMLALAGMGTSAWHPLATGTLAQAMPGRRARVLGIHAMGGTLAEVFAPVLTGFQDELHFVFRCQLYETLPEQGNLLQFCQDKLNSCYNHLEDIESSSSFGQLGIPKHYTY